MPGITETFMKKGFFPLASDARGGIAWRGERLKDFWMWNGLFTEDDGGARRVQTVRVTELKEAALKYWRDGWVPLKPVDDDLLRRMEMVLRSHQGLKRAGITFPNGPFLELCDPIPEKFFGPGERAYLGLSQAVNKRDERDTDEDTNEVRDGEVVL